MEGRPYGRMGGGGGGGGGFSAESLVNHGGFVDGKMSSAGLMGEHPAPDCWENIQRRIFMAE